MNFCHLIADTWCQSLNQFVRSIDCKPINEGVGPGANFERGSDGGGAFFQKIVV